MAGKQKQGPSPAAADKPPTFDEILGELAQVVERLEQGDLPLEEALERFERGVGLARQGERILGQAEKRVELLLARADGDVLEPFDTGTAGGEPDER